MTKSTVGRFVTMLAATVCALTVVGLAAAGQQHTGGPGAVTVADSQWGSTPVSG